MGLIRTYIIERNNLDNLLPTERLDLVRTNSAWSAIEICHFFCGIFTSVCPDTRRNTIYWGAVEQTVAADDSIQSHRPTPVMRWREPGSGLERWWPMSTPAGSRHLRSWSWMQRRETPKPVSPSAGCCAEGSDTPTHRRVKIYSAIGLFVSCLYAHLDSSHYCSKSSMGKTTLKGKCRWFMTARQLQHRPRLFWRDFPTL